MAKVKLRRVTGRGPQCHRSLPSIVDEQARRSVHPAGEPHRRTRNSV